MTLTPTPIDATVRPGYLVGDQFQAILLPKTGHGVADQTVRLRRQGDDVRLIFHDGYTIHIGALPADFLHAVRHTHFYLCVEESEGGQQGVAYYAYDELADRTEMAA